MNGSALNPAHRVKDVRFDQEAFSVDLEDGWTITTTYSWLPRLHTANAAQRNNWQVAGGGYGIH